MHTVCVLSLKGGSGKSTVVQSLAVCALQNGQNTLIIELDPQGTLKDWSRRRTATEPRVHQTLPQSLSEVLEEARSDGANWVFVDTPGHYTPAVMAAAEQADLILIPCKIQSMKDFDAVLQTIEEAERFDKPSYVLMNQVPPNSSRLVRQRQTAILEKHDIVVLSKYLTRRADFEYCDARGLSAQEYRPDGAAAEEIRQLFALVQSIFIAHASADESMPVLWEAGDEPARVEVYFDEDSSEGGEQKGFGPGRDWQRSA
jgi:chromosome partitioning protein